MDSDNKCLLYSFTAIAIVAASILIPYYYHVHVVDKYPCTMTDKVNELDNYHRDSGEHVQGCGGPPGTRDRVAPTSNYRLTYYVNIPTDQEIHSICSPYPPKYYCCDDDDCYWIRVSISSIKGAGHCYLLHYNETLVGTSTVCWMNRHNGHVYMSDPLAEEKLKLIFGWLMAAISLLPMIVLVRELVREYCKPNNRYRLIDL